MLDLQSLRCFLAVADTGSVARAAEALYVSASPLSRRIIALEARIGVVLFQRSRQRLSLTPAGRAFADEARALLAQAERVERRARETARGRRTVAIAHVDGALHCGALLRAMRTIRREFPQARMRVRRMRSAEQFDAIAAGDIDVGLTHAEPPASRGFRCRPVHDEPFLLAVPRRLRLLRRGDAPSAAPARALDGKAFVVIDGAASPTGRREFDAACERAGFAPRIAAEAADPLSALALAEAGTGIALLQASLASRASDALRILPVPDGFGAHLRVYRVERA